ncbi:MAG: ribonuclease Y [Bdellovibrionales bacterium]|nr:ribonuclease Y [Bdellovibrionales bacterium]
MIDSFWMLMSALSGFLLGSFVFLFYLRLFQKRRKKHLKKEVNFIINQAKSKAMRMEKSALSRARDMERKMKSKVEAEIRKEKKQIEDIKYQAERRKARLERDLRRKTEEMESQIKDLEKQKEVSHIMEQQLEKATKKTNEKWEELNTIMEKAASLTKEQAREEIKRNMKEEVQKEILPQLIDMEKKLKEESEKKARLILSQAIARFASEVSTERTTTSIPIKGEETKGKIIGREGRNIRALEAACGVDIIIDESQEIILISGFDSVRREVAVRSIHQLLEEGRVHPARIEEVVGKSKRNIFVSMGEEGRQVCFDLGIHDVKPALIEVLGSLKYRFIEGNTVLKSSIEVAHLAGLIANELGSDEKIAKRAGLFHAVGLGVDHRIEGSYSLVGAEYARKHGESPAVCQAIRCHRGEVPAQSIVDHIVQSAHNLFRERPGARREVIENYINRMKDMESVANSFDGVIRSFAIRIGKEIRVLVDSGKVTDEQSFMLSRDIAEKITKEMDEPGQLTVSVVRECRMVEQAR